MKAISLCSGADGFGLAAQLLGIEVVAHVEIETIFDEHYKRHWPHAQRFYDLTTVDPEAIADADIIFGGEPCQPNSNAGHREGKTDYRYLWPDYFRIVKAKRKKGLRWVINENVTGSISNMVLDTKIADLESIGFTCRPFNIPACAVGADHERQRIWLVAHAKSSGRLRTSALQHRQNEIVLGERWQSQNKKIWSSTSDGTCRGASGRIFPSFDSGLFQGPNDVPTELALLKAYGNAVVPWIPYVILNFILQIEKNLCYSPE